MSQCLCIKKGWNAANVTFEQQSKPYSDMTALLHLTSSRKNSILASHFIFYNEPKHAIYCTFFQETLHFMFSLQTNNNILINKKKLWMLKFCIFLLLACSKNRESARQSVEAFGASRQLPSILFCQFIGCHYLEARLYTPLLHMDSPLYPAQTERIVGEPFWDQEGRGSVFVCGRARAHSQSEAALNMYTQT